MSRFLLGICALTLLSACGVKSDLDRPDPLWNSDEAIRRECERRFQNSEPLDSRCQQYMQASPSAAP